MLKRKQKMVTVMEESKYTTKCVYMCHFPLMGACKHIVYQIGHHTMLSHNVVAVTL